MSLLVTNKLTRVFGTFTAVDALDLIVESGEVFGLLGPNGAGKSTAIKMLTTLLAPTSGDANIGGFSIREKPNEIRKIIGYVPQMLAADGSLTGFENLMLFAKLYDVPWKECRQRVSDALEFMGLSEGSDKKVREYSGGMIRRLEIAQSMLHRPKLLFLDEPTVGLDPIGRKAVWDHILELKQQFGTTVFLTTHLMEEADKLCNRVAFMSRGKLAVVGAPEQLKASLGKTGITLEDVFIHYTADKLESGGSVNYRQVSQERNTARRLG